MTFQIMIYQNLIRTLNRVKKNVINLLEKVGRYLLLSKYMKWYYLFLIFYCSNITVKNRENRIYY
jgi:hypothetical protein